MPVPPGGAINLTSKDLELKFVLSTTNTFYSPRICRFDVTWESPVEVRFRPIVEYQVEAGLVTAEDFATKPPAEQKQIKQTLFEKYARNINPYVALSAVEFGLVGLAKILFKKMEGERLTEAEQDFYEQLRTLMLNHEMTLDTNDWYFSYLASMMQQVQTNRAAYKAKKLETVGEF